MAGAFTPEVCETLYDSMDITPNELGELINRAVERFDKIKMGL